jgi:hypothetical protein
VNTWEDAFIPGEAKDQILVVSQVVSRLRCTSESLGCTLKGSTYLTYIRYRANLKNDSPDCMLSQSQLLIKLSLCPAILNPWLDDAKSIQFKPSTGIGSNAKSMSKRRISAKVWE